MKKSLLWRSLVVVMILAFAVSACAPKAEVPAPAVDAPAADAPAAEAPAAEAPAAEAPAAEEAPAAGSMQIPEIVEGKFNVGAVLLSVHDDGGWSQAQWEALQYLEENGNNIHTAYVESVAEGADSEQVFRALARKGFDLIIGGSFGYMDSMEMVAADFPDQYFIHISGFKSNEENFGNLMGAMENMKYVSGMIAGSRNKLDGATKTGYTATFPIPEETRLGNAFALGLQKTCPECTMDVRWLSTWHDPIVEREAADSLFDAGANVVFTGADTPAPALAAQARGDVWGITYDWVGSCTAERCLTVPYWNWGPEFVRIANGLQDGTYTPGWDYFDSAEGGVGIYGMMEGQELTPGMQEIKEKLPEDWAMIEDAVAKFKSGEMDRFSVFTGPITDNQGNVVLAEGEKFEQADLDCFAVWGTCKVGVGWWNENVTAELPEIQ